MSIVDILDLGFLVLHFYVEGRPGPLVRYVSLHLPSETSFRLDGPESRHSDVQKVTPVRCQPRPPHNLTVEFGHPTTDSYLAP